MLRTLPLGPFALALLAGLGAAPCVDGGDYDSVEELWERYCKMVGARDEVEVLACYTETLRSQLTGDKTAAGRARLAVHMADMFELLFRDYDYRVVEEKEEGERTVYTVKFKHRKKQDEHTAAVVFVSDGERWYIAKHPELPRFLMAGSGTVTMIVGIAIALAAAGFLVKKALA
jgi:hypothetical protein